MAILRDYKTVREILPLAVPTLRKLVSERKIPFIKIGSRVFFDEGEIQEWIEARRVPAVGRR